MLPTFPSWQSTQVSGWQDSGQREPFYFLGLRWIRMHSLECVRRCVVVQEAPRSPRRSGRLSGLLHLSRRWSLASICEFFPVARRFINWRALSLTLFFMLLVSLLWEATGAVPYNWWNFQHRQMTGLFVGAWSRLPIEEVCTG